MPEILTLLMAEPIVTLAYTVFGIVGFGSTLVAAPMLAHLLPVTTVVPTLAMTDLLASWSNGWRLNQHVVKKELFLLVPALIAGSALGAWLLFNLPLKMMPLLLGAFVTLYALYGYSHQTIRRNPLPANWAWCFGFLGGTCSALFGAGGFVYSIYLMRRLEDPQQIRATQTTVLMVSSLIRVGMFLLAGSLLDLQLLLLVALLLPGMALGLYIGHHVNLRLDRQRFLQLLHGVLLLTGVSLIVRSLL
jgi:uncharacterized membrane protein YfcA